MICDIFVLLNVELCVSGFLVLWICVLLIVTTVALHKSGYVCCCTVLVLFFNCRCADVWNRFVIRLMCCGYAYCRIVHWGFLYFDTHSFDLWTVGMHIVDMCDVGMWFIGTLYYKYFIVAQSQCWCVNCEYIWYIDI